MSDESRRSGGRGPGRTLTQALVALGLASWLIGSHGGASEGRSDAFVAELVPRLHAQATGNTSGIALGGPSDRVRVLAFWSPWSESCAGLPEDLSRVVAEQHVGDRLDVSVVAVAEGHDLPTMRAVASSSAWHESIRIESENATVPVVAGPPELADVYALTAVPTVWVVDTEGRLRYARVGAGAMEDAVQQAKRISRRGSVA